MVDQGREPTSANPSYRYTSWRIMESGRGSGHGR